MQEDRSYKIPKTVHSVNFVRQINQLPRKIIIAQKIIVQSYINVKIDIKYFYY